MSKIINKLDPDLKKAFIEIAFTAIDQIVNYGSKKAKSKLIEIADTK